jgi:hypothetical protein
VESANASLWRVKVPPVLRYQHSEGATHARSWEKKTVSCSEYRLRILYPFAIE